MRRTLLLSALALAAPLLVASPASAATVDDFTIGGSGDDLEANPGATLTVAWDVTPLDPAAAVVVTPAGSAVGVVAGWDAPTVAAATASTVDVTIPAAAEEGDDYTFQLVVTENNVPAVSDTITVSVVEEPVEVTPVPVVAVDCVVEIPEVPGVLYDLVYDYAEDGAGGWTGETEPLDPDTYALFELSDGEDLVIAATPDEGYGFPAGAADVFPVAVDEACVTLPVFVEITSSCQSFALTNVVDVDVTAIYGGEDDEEPAGEVTLAPGGSAAIGTDADFVYVFAGAGLTLEDLQSDDLDFLEVQFDGLEVDQDCTVAAAPTHPTVAPAAGR
ncbi:hypothetical protein [Nocardioides zeae]|uniref:Uncharacterized protein n=1 Tax=Nocardioides zeae TaxID=1457234 RepID=A0A6P0HKZ8_9ACTN|nr:hypothetical protein [Nocardioides zeae]NEN79352.1 hypothetical protein [Nocardioides zeae]